MKYAWLLLFSAAMTGCIEPSSTIPEDPKTEKVLPSINGVSLVVLGTIQDAGSPHIACKKECCTSLFENPDPLRKVVSLGITDTENRKNYIFEATPDITSQIKYLQRLSASERELPDGIFVTHAHIGHYSGLMYLGKEATNSQRVPVFAMPRMKSYLETNGPWSQLVSNENIALVELQHQTEIALSSKLKVTPFNVPHRDEYSETVGFKIVGPNKAVLFIPDIDKWEKWDRDISEVLSEVDYAFLDATFFDGNELNTRDISEIPHPFIIESMARFESLTSEEKKKIHFIHFNHTNPVIDPGSDAYKQVVENGFQVARIHQVIEL